ncbi:MAG: GAF domain-containing protein, partial [Chloroflexi bacterium]|nr:GAF domain-containing protein [Chloroflexota bacterium]
MTTRATTQRRRRQIRSGLLVAMLGLVILPVLILTAVSLIREATLQRQNALEELRTVANLQTSEIQGWEVENKAFLEEIITDELLRTPVFQLASRAGEIETPETLDDTQVAFESFAVRWLVDTGSQYDRLVVVNRDGYVTGATDISFVGRNLITEPWVTAMMTAQPDVGVEVFGPQADPIDGRESYYFTTPVVNPANNEIIGVLAGRVRAGRLADVVRQYQVLGASGEVFLVENDSQIFLSAPPTAENVQAGETVAESPVIGEVLAGFQMPEQAWQSYNGESVFGVAEGIPSLGVTLFVTKGVTEVQQGLLTVLLLNGGFGLVVAMVAVGAAVYISGQLTSPLDALADTVTRMARSEEEETVAPESDIHEINELAGAFNTMNTRIRDLLRAQEEAIADRTRQLEITAQMGRVIAAETDLETLMRVTVQMIREELGYYHAQVFLIDDLRQYAVLRASTGDAGRELLSRGHKLAVGSQSVIGQVTERGEPILARDTEDSPVHRRNELLPDTRAELAVPLSIGEQIIGALDIQSVEADAFDDATISVLRTVADQLAVAIRNAQLFTEKEGLLSASLQLTQMLTRDTWSSFIDDRAAAQPLGFEYDLSEVRPIEGENGKQTNGIAKSIALRGQEIGRLQADLGGENLAPEQETLIEQVLDRVALALDNARLFEQTQVSLAETNRLYQASQAISEAATLEALTDNLLTLVSELPAVDRAFLFVLDDPDDPAESRMTRRVGEYDRTDGIYIPERPARLMTGEVPLVGIENIPSNGRVVDD